MRYNTKHRLLIIKLKVVQLLNTNYYVESSTIALLHYMQYVQLRSLAKIFKIELPLIAVVYKATGRHPCILKRNIKTSKLTWGCKGEKIIISSRENICECHSCV